LSSRDGIHILKYRGTGPIARLNRGASRLAGPAEDWRAFSLSGEEITVDFAEYLSAAVIGALEDGVKPAAHDGGLNYFNKLCRRGVRRNWSKLDGARFLVEYHRCIAAAAKRGYVVDKYFASQAALFRNHDPAQIVADRKAIRDEWKQKKVYLHPQVVEALLHTAEEVNHSWSAFRTKYLLLPNNPDSESLEDWLPAHAALDGLKWVGSPTAWYLIRNLYGAPVFKPDVHICAIARHFFGRAESPLDAMSEKVHELWEEVCRGVDTKLAAASGDLMGMREWWDRLCESGGFRGVHLGEVDFILWLHRSKTKKPANDGDQELC
jgi:hypothetical protein